MTDEPKPPNLKLLTGSPGPTAGGELTERQRRFVEAFCLTGNATEAAKRAGYAHPNVQAERIKKIPHVAAAIAAFQVQTTAATVASKQEVECRLTEMLRDELLSPKDKREAMRLLGQMQGWLITKTQVTGPNGGPIQAALAELSLTDLVALLDKTNDH